MDLICFMDTYCASKRSDCYEQKIVLIITSKPLKHHYLNITNDEIA